MSALCRVVTGKKVLISGLHSVLSEFQHTFSVQLCARKYRAIINSFVHIALKTPGFHFYRRECMNGTSGTKALCNCKL